VRLNNHTVKADAGLWETGAAKQNTGFPGTTIHDLKKEKKLIKNLCPIRNIDFVITWMGFLSWVLKILISLDGERTSHK
jgi:hypothetical protein